MAWRRTDFPPVDMDGVTGLAILVAGTVLGTMGFFAVVVTPLVFTRLGVEQARRLLRALFPRYYDVLAILSVGLALLLSGTRPTLSIVIGAVAAGFVVARVWLMPRVNKLRDAELAGDIEAGHRFRRTHRLSVLLNAAQLLAVAAVAALLVL